MNDCNNPLPCQSANVGLSDYKKKKKKKRLQQAIITLPQEQLQILLNPKLELVLALGKYKISILVMTNINIYIRC